MIVDVSTSVTKEKQQQRTLDFQEGLKEAAKDLGDADNDTGTNLLYLNATNQNNGFVVGGACAGYELPKRCATLVPFTVYKL